MFHFRQLSIFRSEPTEAEKKITIQKNRSTRVCELELSSVCGWTIDGGRRRLANAADPTSHPRPTSLQARRSILGLIGFSLNMPPSKTSNASQTNVLPPKDQNVFKSVVRFYETKQLKKALKASDSILRKFPNHGETLAMKGLVLNALDKKDDAILLVRKGLRIDMRSHICWHVYGLLYRSERDYREAAKAYLNALRIDKDNQQILRDLALLQVQIRDYEGLEDTRRRLLTVRPNQRNNWIGFALCFHLLANYDTAISVLDTYQKTLSQPSDPVDRYENSEVMLYKNMILEESGQFKQALEHLDDVADQLVDRTAVLEAKARLYTALGADGSAITTLNRLMDSNPDNRDYQHALLSCVLRQTVPSVMENGFPSQSAQEPARALLKRRNFSYTSSIDLRGNDDAVTAALRLCDDLSHRYPFSRSAARMSLDVIPHSSHPHFLPRLDAYVRPFLRKGIPSLFSDIKPLYAQHDKAIAIGRLFESYRNALTESATRSLTPALVIPKLDDAGVSGADSVQGLHNYGGSGANGFGDDSKAKLAEPPCTLLWVLHFLAQHYDRLGHLDLALSTIQSAIDHSPTAIECHLVRCRILKHCGDFNGAVDVLNETRALDLADRYLNTKCCKYALRADRLVDAEQWVGLFTRDGESGGMQAIYDMQCMWFELGSAESYLRRGHLTPALKMFTAVERHFADIIEDQFDFHSYCLRKVTLRSYVTLLRFEDSIQNHPFFGRAACGLVKCFLRMMDMTDQDRQSLLIQDPGIKGFEDMTSSQRKKAVSKRKKQMAKSKHNGHSSSGGGKSGQGKSEGGSEQSADGSGKSPGSNSDSKPKSSQGWMEQDTCGVELAKDYLKDGGNSNEKIVVEASRLVRVMEKHLDKKIETHRMSFELAMRKRKYLQALRAAKRSVALGAEDSTVLMIVVKLCYALSQEGVLDSLSSVAKDVVRSEGGLLGDLSIAEYVSKYAERNEGHVERRIGAEVVRVWMSVGEVAGCETLEVALSKLCDSIDSVAVTSEGGDIEEQVISCKICETMVEELRGMGVDNVSVAKVSSRFERLFPRASWLAKKG